MGICYQIAKDTSCYEDLRPLLTTCSAIHVALQAHVLGVVKSVPNAAFIISCKHLDLRVALPLHGPIEDALKNIEPDGIGVGVLPGREVTEPKSGFSTQGFQKLFDTVIQPFLVNQYERHRDEIQQVYGDRPKWPDAWQMAWLVRNGLSHNGKVHFDLARNSNPQPVIWRGLTISSADQGEVILGGLINVGDLIVLSLDMAEARSGPLPSVPMADHPSPPART